MASHHSSSTSTTLSPIPSMFSQRYTKSIRPRTASCISPTVRWRNSDGPQWSYVSCSCTWQRTVLKYYTPCASLLLRRVWVDYISHLDRRVNVREAHVQVDCWWRSAWWFFAVYRPSLLRFYQQANPFLQHVDVVQEVTAAQSHYLWLFDFLLFVLTNQQHGIFVILKNDFSWQMILSSHLWEQPGCQLVMFLLFLEQFCFDFGQLLLGNIQLVLQLWHHRVIGVDIGDDDLVLVEDFEDFFLTLSL